MWSRIRTRLPTNYPPILGCLHLSATAACCRGGRHKDAASASVVPLTTGWRIAVSILLHQRDGGSLPLCLFPPEGPEGT